MKAWQIIKGYLNFCLKCVFVFFFCFGGGGSQNVCLTSQKQIEFSLFSLSGKYSSCNFSWQTHCVTKCTETVSAQFDICWFDWIFLFEIIWHFRKHYSIYTFRCSVSPKSDVQVHATTNGPKMPFPSLYIQLQLLNTAL